MKTLTNISIIGIAVMLTGSVLGQSASDGPSYGETIEWIQDKLGELGMVEDAGDSVRQTLKIKGKKLVLDQLARNSANLSAINYHKISTFDIRDIERVSVNLNSKKTQAEIHMYCGDSGNCVRVKYKRHWGVEESSDRYLIILIQGYDTGLLPLSESDMRLIRGLVAAFEYLRALAGEKKELFQ